MATTQMVVSSLALFEEQTGAQWIPLVPKSQCSMIAIRAPEITAGLLRGVEAELVHAALASLLGQTSGRESTLPAAALMSAGLPATSRTGISMGSSHMRLWRCMPAALVMIGASFKFAS